MLGYMEDEVRWSYCVKCITNQYFHIVDGIWVCDDCKQPLQLATKSAENMNKYLQESSNQSTIVT